MKIQSRRSGRPLSPDLLSDPRLDRLAEWGIQLAATGLSPDASGNLSCRSQDGFLITATGVPLGEIRAEDWVEVTAIENPDDATIVVQSNGVAEPSRDAAVHATVYRHRPEATAIFHLHVGNLDELHERLGVPATEEFHPAGTTESVAEIERFLDADGEIRYFILVNHGIVAWGETVEEAAAEVTARQRALGDG